jgi:predicted RND superfamily exporter protein
VSVWERVADFTVRRSRPMLAALAALTLLFAVGLSRIEVDTTFLSFVSPETRALVETIENDFGEGSYLTLIFESRSEKSLLEPELLHQQFRIIQEIERAYPVTTFSLVGGIDQGLRRVRHQTLLETDDYSIIAEAILGVAGGRTVRDLEKVSAHFLSHPQAVAFYGNLRIAQGAAALPAPGAPQSTYAVPYVRAIKALVRTEPGESRHARRLLMASIRDRVDALATPEVAVYALNDDLVSYDIDRDTQRNVILLGLMVAAIDTLCVLGLFRSRRELAVVFAILAAACVWTFGLAGFLGVRLSFLHLLGVPILLGTGIDDTLVFGRRMAEERRRLGSFQQALRATFSGVGNAMFLTSLTTGLGFAIAALTSPAGVVASFFLLYAVSMLFAFALEIPLEGALRAEFARHDARAGSAPEFRPSPLDSGTAGLTRLAQRVVDAGARPVLLGSGLVLALALGSATRLQADLSRKEVLRSGTPTYRADEVLRRYFPDTRVGYVLFAGAVENPTLLRKMRTLEQHLSRVPQLEQVLGTANVDSVVDLVGKLGVHVTPQTDVHALFDRIRSSDRTADYVLDMSFHDAADYVLRRSGDRYDGLLMRFFVMGAEGSNSLVARAAIRRELEALSLDRIPGVEVSIGGGDIIYPLESARYVSNLSRSFFLSLLGNLLVLIVAWRRIGASLVAMVPIALAAAVVVGAMPLFGVNLNPLNLGIGAIVVGLGIDYPIYVMERFEEERRRGRPAREAARVTLGTMGPHMLAAMLTTVLGFAASCAMLLPMSTSFGLLTGAAILLVYLATLFVLPALLVWLHGVSSATR